MITHKKQDIEEKGEVTSQKREGVVLHAKRGFGFHAHHHTEYEEGGEKNGLKDEIEEDLFSLDFIHIRT